MQSGDLSKLSFHIYCGLCGSVLGQGTVQWGCRAQFDKWRKQGRELGPSSSLGFEMVQSFPDFTDSRTNLQHVCVSKIKAPERTHRWWPWDLRHRCSSWG